MLALFPITDDIKHFYKENKLLSSKFIESMSNFEEIDLNSGTNIFSINTKHDYIYIKEGVCKAFYNDKLLRFYSEGDIICLYNGISTLSILAEFSITVVAFSYTNSELNKIISNDNQLNLCLLSTLIKTNFNSNIELKLFPANSKIITEGDEPDVIYEMISGTAAAYKNNIKLGEIYSGEVFGEISFLSNTKRTASVIALSRCEVLVINKTTFEYFVKEKPEFLQSLSKTLAGRIINLNTKLIS